MQVDQFITSAMEIAGPGPIDRTKLESILKELCTLANERELWGGAKYPDPEQNEHQARYLIKQYRPDGLTLYLNVMRPGKKIPPHNHTTWACVAPVEGAEINRLYERLDDGSRPGHAEIKQSAEIVVEDGVGVALMPDDIHSVEITGTKAIRHLHLYGRPLENLSERLMFNMDDKTVKVMGVGVKTRR